MSNQEFFSTKTFSHSEGLSCNFRQWRADSHCHYCHGYALKVRFTFGAHELDTRNWVVDFGGLKELKTWLHSMFDHTTLVAEDDPHKEFFLKGQELGVMDVRILPSVGCEKTADFIFQYVNTWLQEKYGTRVWLETVEVSEHEGNSAIAQRQKVSSPSACSCQTLY